MRTSLQINFRGMAVSPALEQLIRERTEKLERFHPNLTGCRVVVDKPHQHKAQGEHFIVSVELSVPGGNIMANHAHHEDVNVALRDAFLAARRQLDEHARKLRGDVKSHSLPQAGDAEVDGQAEAEVER